MLNLLFISDSPKMEHIKNVLQPELRVVIDVVPDFDYGLKEVFDKRPATVCIQEEIAGVTGESVARHIKMLFGSSTPSFILMHEGSGKAKQIKGIFEHTVDLSQPEAGLAEEILSTLRTLFGDQWDKIFISPGQAIVSNSPSTVLSEEPGNDVDEQASGFSLADDAVSPLHPEPAVEETKICIAQSAADTLAELQVEHARRVEIASEKNLSVSNDTGQDLNSKEVVVPRAPAKSTAENTSPTATVPVDPSKPVQTGSAGTKPKQVAKSSVQKGSESHKFPDAALEADKNVSLMAGHSSPVAPAEFRVNHGKTSLREQIPDDLLLAFEKNYRSESNLMKRVVIASFVLLLFVTVCGWYFVKQNPDFPASIKQWAISAARPIPAPVADRTLSVARPSSTGQKPDNAIVEKTSAPHVFPTFIPRDGHDKTYAAQKPGWERYVGKQVEFRVFSAGGKLKAVQIIAAEGNVVSESLLKTVLAELAGSENYQINSQEKKSGFLLLRGTVAQKADVLFYKKDSRVKAVVVSLF